MNTGSYSYLTWLVFGLLVSVVFFTSSCDDGAAEKDKKMGVLFIGAGMEGDLVEPHQEYWLKWIYGNDVPESYGYELDVPEAFNVKSELEAMFPDRELVFRHGYQSQMETATREAIRELIEDEEVDRIVVASGRSHFSNGTVFGECWEDGADQGVSVFIGTTYKACVYDVNNGYGPEDQASLDAALAERPFASYAPLFPQVVEMVAEVDSGIEVTFAGAVGKQPEYGQAIVDLFVHTVQQKNIPGGASIVVIVATDGPSDSYADQGACDMYTRDSQAVASFAKSQLLDYLGSSWLGEYEVIHGETERAQPTESGNYDPPSDVKPFGDIVSTGEAIDQMIEGFYVNGMGARWEGTGGTDYVVVLPLTWVNDTPQTLVAGREQTLGNHERVTVGTEERWLRQTHDSDGTPYDLADENDYDAEFSTVRVMDMFGWPSTPEGLASPIFKGIRPLSTTVILSGAILSSGDTIAKRHAALAMVNSVVDAINNPSRDGRLNTECQDSP
jgi:hypothetical protein